jgi:hypothetical protein
MLKVNSIKTSEALYDARGQSLQNVQILWNDQQNPYWKEQFIQVFNRISSSNYGSVGYNERVQYQDILFELYQLNNQPTETGVFPYTAIAAGATLPMECVPAQLSAAGPSERRPTGSASSFSMLYGSDGLGDQSDLTGFFLLTKQGNLTKTRVQLDGRTPNQVIPVNITNINQTDVWVNNVDPTTGSIIDDGTNPDGLSGEWVQVNLESAENVIFNTITNPNKYEVETKDSDKINIIFGDGEFATIPSGTFDIWTRASANSDTIIPKSSIQGVPFSMQYRDERNQLNTVTITASVTGPIQNSNVSEDIERIRRVAPSVYYTQDRMVNGRDYNSYLLRDPTILKLKAVNRAFAGQSKYRAFDEFGGDPSETYDNVRIFGTDLAVYYKDNSVFQYLDANLDPSIVVNDAIEPILLTSAFYMYRSTRDFGELSRITFNNSVGYIADQNNPNLTVPDFNDPVNNKLERASILYAMGSTVTVGSTTYTNPNPTFPVDIYYDNDLNRWRTTTSSVFDPFNQVVSPQVLISIDKQVIGNQKWVVQNVGTKLYAESNTTNFWNNTVDPIISFETGNPVSDTIEVLDLNRDASRTQLLTAPLVLPVIGQPSVDISYPDVGLPNTQQLLIGFPTSDPTDTKLLPIIDPVYTFNGPFTNLQQITLPFSYLIGRGDILITTNVGSSVVSEGTPTITSGLTDQITVVDPVGLTSISVKKTDFVYFQRASINDLWSIIDNPTQADIRLFDSDVAIGNSIGTLYKREHGRSNLNFLWRHYTNQYHLIDPAATNIVDALVLTKSHYVNTRRWLAGELFNRPLAPTPFELRSAYQVLLNDAMISDTVVVKPGQIRILFGSRAISELRGTFRLVKSPGSTLTDNEIKIRVIQVIDQYFDVNRWDFGQTFYYTELAAAIHNDLGTNIETVVLIPLQLGNVTDQLLTLVTPREDEIFVPDVTVSDIEIVTSLVRTNIKQVGLT